MKAFVAIVFCAYAGAVVAQETAPAEPPTAEQEKPQAAAQADSSASAKLRARADRLDLETTIVTGNRELPKVLYIVPWKKAELGELPAQPFNTLLDEVLAPVDRDVFKREVKYFHTVSQSAAAAPNPGGANESAAPAR